MTSMAHSLNAVTRNRLPSNLCLSKATLASQLLCRHTIRPFHKLFFPTFYQHLRLSQGYLGRRGGNHKRRWLSSSPRADKSGQSDSTGKINERGGIWIYIGWTILGLVGVDQALQYKQEQVDNERRRMIAEMQLEADSASVNVADWDESLPTVFTCKILHVDPGLDGTKMLTRSKSKTNNGGIRSGINRHIKRGDVVEVLKAGVGPNQAYHLCRMREQKSDSIDSSAMVVGWYPIEYLERLD
mmetsp:Transcript_3268/g.7182  ORF Transcript_3268/g.7182 Transcript_3268/m.7182 type:complete len:242 (+) Transcript_3268:128-853(+)|eukprot:CAMPEP_0201134556 /NCGR_PEP_ID=MMETSP0850-20130426/51931_1 /ASSEMBLY_ACC=CAM_ASM_000622 /TAXON_ID=183588 /ORGANISM="Pseudo-nitzschia fraudulenta, Strain WWA7" /LENGTH=241 /DNA_ID=CAMNT_0047405477 /DNA_START=65 /DNA_END=793 /DNA_ORIENTATION=-